MTLWATLTAAALAATPVLYEAGTAEDALAQVVTRTGLPADQLEAVDVFTVLASAPMVHGEAVMRHCSGAPSTMTEIRAELARAQASWDREQSTFQAMDHLDLAISRLGCLQELAEPAPIAALFAMRGALSASRPEIAREELRSGLGFSTDLAWPRGFPEADARLLDEARAEPAPHTLQVSPAGTPAGPWIDGRTVDGGSRQLGAGLHLLQTATTAGIRSAWLGIGGDAQLVLPANYRRPLLGRLRSPDQQASIGWLLAATGPDFRAGYAVSEGGVWLFVLDGTEMTVEELTPAEAAEPPPSPKWWQRLLFWRSE